MPYPLSMTAAVAGRSDFPPPGHTYSKTAGQLTDRALASIQCGKKLTPQIIIVRLRHPLFVAGFASK
jgi:hypothetical protein